MAIDGFIIWLLILAGFWRYRVERQREIEDARVEWDKGGYGRSQS